MFSPAGRFSGKKLPSHPGGWGAGVDHEIRPPGRGYRFTQEPCRKRDAVGEGGAGVQQEDVQVAPQPQMLVPVIEDEQVGAEFLHGAQPRLVPVGTDDHQQPRHLFGEQARLVPRLLGGEEHPGPIGHDPDLAPRGSAIAARQHGDALAPGDQVLGDPGDHRGFPGPAQGDVPHRDHRTGQGVRAEQAEPVA